MDMCTVVLLELGWTHVIFIICTQGFPGGSDGKESACNSGDPSLIPRSERSPGEGNAYSSILAWRILWIEEPGELQPMRSQRVGEN